jgi:hypothetical protein
VAALRAAGAEVLTARLPDPGQMFGLPPTRLAEFGWMATKGTAWLVRRSRDLVPALVGLAIREWLTADDEVTERDLVPAGENFPT